MFAIVLLSWGGSQMGLEICSRVGFNRDTLPTRWGTQLNGNFCLILRNLSISASPLAGEPN